MTLALYNETSTASRDETDLATLQGAMLDATLDCIKVLSVDGRLLSLNRAGCIALNIPEDSPFGMEWVSALPPEVRVQGRAAVKKAASGVPARFIGQSLSPDGLMYWDNLLTPLMDATGTVTHILGVSRDVTQKQLLEQQIEAALEREKLLAREMQHRVKNLFSVVTGLLLVSQRTAQAAGDHDPTPTLIAKLDALARASDAVFVQDNMAEGSYPTDVALIVPSVLQPYGEQCTYEGPTAQIRRSDLPTLALMLHELATNSIKYGALSRAEGRIEINWTTKDQTLVLTWVETGGPEILAPPTKSGFGMGMVDRVVRGSRGTIERIWGPGGLYVTLRMPCEA